MPIEFSWVGDGGELATAVCMNVAPCKVLWAFLETQSLQTACAALREREQIHKDRQEGIGIFMPGGSKVGPLADWCAVRPIDDVIWTALPSRFEGRSGDGRNARGSCGGGRRNP